MIIYLDESGDLGLNFEYKKTSRYLVIGLLVFPDGASSDSHKIMMRAVKRTLKNKLPKYTSELKGNKLTISLKKYFFKEIQKGSNWRLYVAIADKKSWMNHHLNSKSKVGKKALYDEVSKRLFSLVDDIEKVLSIDIVIDCSKNRSEIVLFDNAITSALSNRIAKNALLSIRHCSSHEYAGLQAIDLFCSGVREKYEQSNLSWYHEFSERIATEVEYKF